MNPSEMFAIRTRLRNVNVEFSALVKDKTGEGRYLRMRELKAERAEFPECVRTLSQVGARWRRLIEGVLEAGRQQGEFGVSGPHMARVISSMIMGVAEASRCFGTVESPASSPEELWGALVAFLDHGVLAPQGEVR